MNKIIFLATLLLVALLLAGCNLSASNVETTAPAPEALFTSAAQTADAMRLQRFGLTPSPPAAEAMIATAAAVTPTLTAPSAPITTTLAAPNPTKAPTSVAAPGAAAPATTGDKAEYVADVTVPDGTTFSPGESFEKTWRIANTGTTTWTTAYELVFIDGDLLGAPDSVPLPEEVAPGKQVEITVDMVAPDTPRSYISYWKLRTPNGQIVGFGSAGTEAIWAKITVSGEGGGSNNETPAPSSGAIVNEITLSVDNSEVTGACPHTFQFTAQVGLNRASTIAYALEAGSASGEVRAPLPATRNLAAGVHSLVFDMTVPTAINAWARLRLTQPEEVLSNQVNFSLACQ